MTDAQPYARAVGNALRLVRADRRLTQREVADAVGIGQSAWSRIELGVVAVTVEQLASAAARLGTAPGSILELADCEHCIPKK